LSSGEDPVSVQPPGNVRVVRSIETEQNRLLLIVADSVQSKRAFISEKSARWRPYSMISSVVICSKARRGVCADVLRSV